MGFTDLLESIRERAEFWGIPFPERLREKLPPWAFIIIIASLISAAIITSAVLSVQGVSPPEKGGTDASRKVSTKTKIKEHLRMRDFTGETEPGDYDKALGDNGSESLEKEEYIPETLLTWGSLTGTPHTTGVRSLTTVTSRSMRFLFKCYGRAHGVGLCMDGVSALAERGKTYREILSHYYTNVTPGHVDENMKIRVKARSGRVLTMSMKDYLYRLAEEPESYPMEGLKALYVAARTYVLSCIERGKHSGDGYDVCSSGSCCQAFDENKNLSSFPRNISAADATAGQILLYLGKPIVAAYCGSCGGHTENNEDVWGGRPLPYLRGKPDPYCSGSPRFARSLDISVSELESRLNSSSATSVGELKSIDLTDRTPGGRIRTARFKGKSGEKVVKGTVFAKLLGFSSTKIEYTILSVP